MNTTIVSAFIPNINKRKSTAEYLKYGNVFLSTPVQKYVFLDESLKEYSESFINQYNTFEFIKKEDLSWIKEKENCYLFQDKSEKDTWDYMITMINKTEWINRAIDENPYKSNQFIWVDFGIQHVITDSDANYQQKLVKMTQKSYNRVRIAHITNASYYNQLTIHQQLDNVLWFFAGGVFGGSPEYLKRFATLVKEKVEMVIKTYKKITWEVNIWFFINKTTPELFDCYKCDHNNSILDNY
jgi:hypothetical protein